MPRRQLDQLWREYDSVCVRPFCFLCLLCATQVLYVYAYLRQCVYVAICVFMCACQSSILCCPKKKEHNLIRINLRFVVQHVCLDHTHFSFGYAISRRQPPSAAVSHHQPPPATICLSASQQPTARVICKFRAQRTQGIQPIHPSIHPSTYNLQCLVQLPGIHNVMLYNKARHYDSLPMPRLIPIPMPLFSMARRNAMANTSGIHRFDN